MPTPMSGEEVVRALDKLYPRIKTPLKHGDAFQLLIATILSAQSTDVQVNKVTEHLFQRFPDASSMADADLKELRKLVRSTGFFRVKSLRIKEVSRKLVQDFGGRVPSTMEELISLPGVGRKTANIVLSAGYGKAEGVAVDTHVKRLSKRIGLTKHTNPDKIERDLMKSTRRDLWPRLSLLLILHGRNVCFARKPVCQRCVLSARCAYFWQNSYDSGGTKRL
ncbi:MAG TPA: endonuclease III [Nitrososphaerales archaeon]|nr:endonuclease III [Nitrososphaerales archaeon]